MLQREAKLAADWAQTAEVLAAVYNTIRDPKKRSKPYSGAEFNPILLGRKKTTKRAGLEALSVLMKPGQGGAYPGARKR